MRRAVRDLGDITGHDEAIGEPQGAGALDLLGGARVTVWHRARGTHDLKRGETDAAADRVNQDALGRTQPCLRDQRVVRGDERLRHGAGIRPR